MRPSARHLFLVVGIFFINLPIIYMIFALSQTSQSLSANGVTWIWGGEFWSNLVRMLSMESGFGGDINIPSMLFNSFATATGFASGTSILSFLAAYSLRWFRLPGRGLVFALILCTLFLPLEMRILPTFDVAVSMGLYNSFAGIILPLIASPLALFFFYQHFRTVPDALTEAAILDGAGPFKFLIDILVPMSMPRILVVFVITFVMGWNQYLWPLIITSDETYFTLVRGMTFAGGPNLMSFSLALIAILPPAFLVVLFQKKLTNSLYDGIH